MTIRFTCTECGSVLKIKDEKAGTDGHCPKCKTAFRVPDLENPAEELEADSAMVTSPAEPAATITEPVPSSGDSIDAEPILRMDDDDFDSPPMLSMSDDDAVAPAKAAEPEAKSVESKSEEPKPVKKKAKPKVDDDFDPAEFLSEGPPPPKWKMPPPSSTEIGAFGGGLSMEDDAPRPPREPSKPTKPTPASGSTAAAAAAAWDTKMAAKQMQKAIKDSRADAVAAKEAAEKGEGFDYAGFFREFGLKGLAGLVGIIVLTYGLYMVVDRVMGRGITLPPLGYVTGNVTLDGAPLAGAQVFFSPQAEASDTSKKSSIRPRTSVAVTDDKGHYRMVYVDGIEGVAIGQCRIWLSKLNEKGLQVVPGEFSELNLTLREVKSGSQKHDFAMISPPGAKK